MKERILITGGAGFIGSAIIKHFNSSEAELFVLDNLSFGSRDFIATDDAHFFRADILDQSAVNSIFEKVMPARVLHLAAIHFIPYCNQHPFESSDINIRGTIHILKAAAAQKVRQLLFASTAAVYPICDEAVSETHPTQPMDIYGLSKLAGEHLCHEFFLETGINTIICRFFNAFGPNETNPHLIPEIQKQVNDGLRKIKLGNLTPKRDFIHTYDMAAAIETLLNKANTGYDTFNLGRGIEYSVTEIVEAFERQIGEKIEIEVDQARVRKVERMHLLADVSKLKSLGWEPKIGIDEGISTLVKKRPA
jgi:UDP-glucose 4-epimerase